MHERIRPLLIATGCLVVILGHPRIGSAAESPTNLTSRLNDHPLGLQVDDYSLSWNAPGARASHVLVASSPQLLAAGVGDLWDTGWRRLAEEGMRYRGKPMPGGATVWWKVRVQGEDGRASAFSMPAAITTAGTSLSRTRQLATHAGDTHDGAHRGWTSLPYG